MAQSSSHVYTFGDFRLDTRSGSLFRNNRQVPLTPKVYDTLLLLVENAGRLVEKDEFIKRLWPDTFVGDDALAQNVSLLRKVFAESGNGTDYIVTVPKRGYRFVTQIEQQEQQHNVRRHSRRTFPVMAASVLAAGLLALLWEWLPLVPRKAAATSGTRAMAVIEIENLSQDPSLNWLGDGVVDLLTTDLAQANTLDVISSERVRNLISREVKSGESLPASRAQRVAQNAGADIFISGALLNMGKGLRLNLRVQDTTSGKVLLADKFEGDSPQAIFSMVDEASAHIVSQLTPAQIAAQPNAARLTSNLDALRSYEEGINYMFRVFNDQAATSFRRATEFDPQFAMAYYELAAMDSNYRQRRQALDKAAQLAQRHGLSEEQRLLIQARQLEADGRSEESIQTLQTIVRRFPKEIESRILLGNLLKYQGRFSESTAVLEDAARLDDPKRNRVYNGLAYTYAYQGDLSRALGAVDKYAALLPPNDPNPIDTRADIYALGGRFDEAIAEYEKNVEAHPEFSMPEQKIALACLLAGRYREAKEAARFAYKHASRRDRAFAANVLGDVALGRGSFGIAIGYFAEAARLIEPEYPQIAHAETWKAAEIYFEQREPQAALFWAKRTRVLGAAEIRGVAYLLLKNEPAAEREFAAARAAMVPLLGDYMAARFIAFDRLRAASYSGQWNRVIAGWPEFSGSLGSANAFFLGRAHAEMGMLPQAEKELRDGLVWVSPGNLIGSYSDFFCYELNQFYLGKVFELEGKKTDAVDSYRAFVSHFTKSNARLPEIAEARAALRRLS